jgi:predicted deacylase
VIAEFSPAYRLSLLQNGDSYRTWRSLDDERFCVRCTKLFTGHDLQIVPQADGQFDIHCPTEGCDSVPVHWFFHGTGLGRSAHGDSQFGEADISGL